MSKLTVWQELYPKDKYPYFNSFIERFEKLDNSLKSKRISEKQEKLVLREYFKSFPLDMLYAGLIHIIDPTPKEITLVPMKRKAQMDIIEITAKYLKDDKPLFITIPKSRKEGISTIIEAIFLVLTTNISYMHAFIVADKLENTENIFSKTKFMHKRLPDYIKPTLKKNKGNELMFNDNGSNLVISTARVSEAGRSWDFQLIHFSEVAYFPETYSENIIRKSILNTLPSNVFVMVVFESTGNGEGGFYYDITMNAFNKKNDYILYFIPWFKSDINKIPLDEGEKFKYDKIYGDEEEIQKKYNLTYAQLKFRRFKLKNVFDYNIQDFNLEYPSELKDCFQSKSLTAFDHKQLDLIDRYTTPPLFVGALNNKNQFYEDKNGYLMIWKKPVKGWRHRYVVSADTGGTYQKRLGVTADYSFAVVYDRILEQDVAVIRGHYKSLVYAKMLISLGYYYNKALLVIEVNRWESINRDTNVLRYLTRSNYPNLYYRTHIEEGEVIPTKKLGFHTNAKTRPIIFEKIDDQITYISSTIRSFDGEIPEDFHPRLNSHLIIRDIKAIRFNPLNGKYEAQGKDKDDGAVAFGMGLVVEEEMPRPYQMMKDDSNNVTYQPKTHSLPVSTVKTRGII